MTRRNLAFNSTDKQTGYAIRFEQSKDGFWLANATQFPALSVGRTIGKAKAKIGEAIQLYLRSMKERE